MQVIIQRLTEIGAVGDHGNHRNIQLFQQDTHFSGQHRCRAVKGIASLREHQNRGLLFLQHILHIPDQAHIADKLLGWNTAQQRHQQPHHRANKAVGCGNDTIALGEEDMGSNFQIRKTGVIHQNQARFVFSDLLHSLFADCQLQRKQLKERQDPNHDLQQEQGPQRIPVLLFGHLHYFFIGAFSNCCFHSIILYS